MQSDGNLPNPLTLPGYRCKACGIGLIKTWSIYAHTLWFSVEQQYTGVLHDAVPRLQCPGNPSASGGWAEHAPERTEGMQAPVTDPGRGSDR